MNSKINEVDKSRIIHISKRLKNVGLKALNEKLNNGKSILNIGNTQTY